MGLTPTSIRPPIPAKTMVNNINYKLLSKLHSFTTSQITLLGKWDYGTGVIVLQNNSV